MAFVAFVLGLVTALAGIVGVVAPRLIIAMAVALHGPLGLAFASGIRLLFGTALFLAAPASRAPLAFRVLGIVTFAAGLALPLLGVDRFDALIDWWAAQPAATVRLGAAFGGGVGILVTYGIIPRHAR